MLTKQQNFIIEYPHFSSLKPSFCSTAFDSVNKSPLACSLENFSLNFCEMNKAKVENPDKIQENIGFSGKKDKRFSCQQPFFAVKRPYAEIKPSKKRNSWCLMRNLVKGLQGFMSPVVMSIKDEKEFEENINDSKLSPQFSPTFRNSLNKISQPYKYKASAFNYVRKQERFFLLIQEGGPEALEAIKSLFIKDPGRFMRDKADPESLSNKKSREGETPLYLACKHGHLEIAEFLLQQKANPHILSRNDSVLAVCARWNYEKLLVFLLKEVQWSLNELTSAVENAENPRIIAHLRAEVNKTPCLRRIFRCFY